MGNKEKMTLVQDSRSENLMRRLLVIPKWIRLSRRRRFLLATSGCLVKCTDWES